MGLTLKKAINSPLYLSKPEKQREFKKLRLSITESCNLNCSYCDRKRNFAEASKNDISYLLNIVENLYKNLNLKSIRITGGEPTLHPELTSVVSFCKKIGFEEVNLTTNGVFLEPLIPDLKKAGINRINISLDGIESGVFKKVTGKDDLRPVVESIMKTLEYDIPIKINSVIMKSLNENQVLPILKFGLKNNIPVRFLELMKMGEMYPYHEKYFYPAKEILSEIQKKYMISFNGRAEGETSMKYRISDYEFGIIANHSVPFCNDCDRLRLDHTGNLFGCLSSTSFVNMLNIPLSNYKGVLEEAMKEKMKDRFQGSVNNMRMIGG